ncbi:hypothetical protein SPI_04190 [Niveomyces insectorum RCEF 264]|uniref:Uncharacterized protein n=1 Tax=Niveomyces insectorum RCEF 264 TaxID=1081102 RepID=A0A167VIB1_9HYPO|nr:hypothetical protein SPI_04190 [Niveomyces insectorum RCEF 264]
MHPAPSLTEAPPSRDEPRQGQQRPMSAGSASTDQRRTPSTPTSPPVRKDTTSSNSTTVTTVTSGTSVTVASGGARGETPYSAAVSISPTYSSQAIFAVQDDVDVANRRPSRRRTGPLSASQREKAALIRKMGACPDCRRRRVAVTMEMDIDTVSAPTTPHRTPTRHQQQQQPQQQPQQQQQQQQQPHTHMSTRAKPQQLSLPPPPPPSGRLSVSSELRLRTPLPSGRNLEKLAAAALPGIDVVSGDLQNAAARIINSANPNRSRYDAVHVMMLLWNDEPENDVRAAAASLAALLEEKYHYAVDIVYMPAKAQSPYRWLLQAVTDFINNRDMRDTLKILYYAGCSYLNEEREMVLSSSMNKTFGPTIRWSGIQQVLEDATSDTLVLMDAAYYPCSKMKRREGVLELIAASAGEDSSKTLGRISFTQALTEELRTRLDQTFRGPLAALSAAELHVRLMASYPRMIQDRNPEMERILSFPSPLHLQMSASARLPSILLAPCRTRQPGSPHAHTREALPSGTQLTLTLRLAEGGVDKAGWVEWMRLLPEGVCDVKCENAFRSAYR